MEEKSISKQLAIRLCSSTIPISWFPPRISHAPLQICAFLTAAYSRCSRELCRKDMSNDMQMTQTYVQILRYKNSLLDT